MGLFRAAVGNNQLIKAGLQQRKNHTARSTTGAYEQHPMPCKVFCLQMPKQIANKAKAIGVICSPARGVANERVDGLSLLSTFGHRPAFG